MWANTSGAAEACHDTVSQLLLGVRTGQRYAGTEKQVNILLVYVDTSIIFPSFQ